MMGDRPANIMQTTTTAQQGQLEQFIERASAVPLPRVSQVEGPDGPDTEPTVPFPSALVLSGSQEKALVDRALMRIKQLEQETGRDKVMLADWYSRDNFDPEQHADSWMVKRTRFEAIFGNDLSWRPRVYGGIFNESNLTVPLSRRICRQMIARAQNYFFGTDPWFSAEPEGVEDGPLAETVERYLKWKLGKLGSKRAKERAIRHALVRGECVLKTTYTVRDQVYDTFADVLVDEADQPILDAAGEYITSTDKWEAQMYFDPMQGMPVPDPSRPEVLARDGVTPAPEVPNWKKTTIKRRQVLFEGPECKPLFFKDILAPLTAPDLQMADCVVHLYDKPVIELVNQFLKDGMLDMTSPERAEATQRAVDLIREMGHNTGAQKAGVNLATRPNDDEENTADSRYGEGGAQDPVAEIAEVYLWFDANGDGVQENVCVLIDRNSRRPIFYDHVANLTPDGMRPFDVVRINEVDDRWYGLGVMETFDSAQRIVDLLVNRWNLSQSRAGRTDFWRPDLTLEGRSNPDLVMNVGRSYTAVPDADPSKILTSVYLNDSKFEHLQAMFEFFMQMAMNESGVQHANDGAAIGLDSQKLATGIKNIEKAGQEMFAPILSDLEPGLASSLNRELLTLMANLSQEETFRYLNQSAETITATVNPDDLVDLSLDVSLLLTRYKGEQQFQQMLQASQVVTGFYALPPEVQARVAPLYQGMVKALDTKIDAEEMISPMMPILPPMGEGGPGGGGAPAAPPARPQKPPVPGIVPSGAPAPVAPSA